MSILNHAMEVHGILGADTDMMEQENCNFINIGYINSSIGWMMLWNNFDKDM